MGAVVTSHSSRHRYWRFGDCTLDERALTLRVGGRVVDLPRKQLQVLRYLLSRAGEIVYKEELAIAVWAGRCMSDSNLTKCVALLRRALADDRHAIIETAHCFGYRLAVPVCSSPLTDPAANDLAGPVGPVWGGALPRPA